MSDELPEAITHSMLEGALYELGLGGVTVEKVEIDADFITVTYLPADPKMFRASATWVFTK